MRREFPPVGLMHIVVTCGEDFPGEIRAVTFVKDTEEQQDHFPPMVFRQPAFQLFPACLAFKAIMVVPVADVLGGKIFPEGGVYKLEDASVGIFFRQQTGAPLGAPYESFRFLENLCPFRAS